jgi:CubicO group peptidase (beta-lactamase class C family)
MTAGELTAALGGFLSTLAGDDAFSGVVLVARNGAPVFHRAYGFADRANKIPNTTRTRFNIGSINKTFTQLAISQLAAEGKLATTDTIATLLPDYPQATSRTATVQQLLTHSAGVSDFFGPAFASTPKDRFRSNADYARFVGTLPPLFAPGERRQYCNGCYILLGAIVERASGMPYEQYVAERIFKAADMTSTGYPQVDAIEPDIAIGYTRRSGQGPDGPLRSNVYLHGASGSAAGGGYSTTTDLLAFANAMRTGRFGKTDGGLGIAGGAPGVSAVVESGREWTVIVFANIVPPSGVRLGVAIMEALSR